MSRSMILEKRSFSAWLECVMSSVRSLGRLWYSSCMICTATSVFPVPGGPTTMVRPGFTPARIAATCVSVNRTVFKRAWSCEYGPGSGGVTDSTFRTFTSSSVASASSAWPFFLRFLPSSSSFGAAFAGKVTLNGGLGSSLEAPTYSMVWSAKASSRCALSRKVSLKVTVLSWSFSGMLVKCAAAGSPYPRKMSCSHSGMAHSSFIRSRMHSRIALKLFSFGLRLMRTLNVLYTSSWPPSTVAVASI
mmetsp:Transcript_39424/g.66210  ORF Transcript_39424/g.66210 Transcript_39424/m.66210 type:complete len:247 (+) Transcript_39424:1608-2348(+)